MVDKNGERELLLMRQVYVALRSLVKKLDSRDSRSAQALTAGQYAALLAILYGGGGEAGMASVARRMRTTKQNLNQMVPALEKKGFVERTTREGDKRVTQLWVTEEGLRAMAAYTTANAEEMRLVFGGFGEDELVTLLGLLQKLHMYDGVDFTGFERAMAGLMAGEGGGGG